MTQRTDSRPAPGAEAAPAEAPHLTRQAIVDRDQRIVGYAFGFHPTHAGAPDPQGLPPLQAAGLSGVRMLARLLGDQDVETSIARTQLFVPTGSALLQTEFLELLDPSRTVLVLAPDVEPTLPAIQRVDALRTRGFRIALDEAAALGSGALWLPQAAFVRVGGGADGAALAPIASANALRRHGARLMADGVDTHARFDALHRSGIDLFQGSWFAHPESLRAKTVQPAWGALLRALSLAQQDAPPQAIEAALRVDAALSFRLLRYIGAAGIAGGRGPLRSIADAVSLIGYRQLVRWLGMLLVTTDGGPDRACGALARTALTRARLMELLPLHGPDAPTPQDRFLAGLFSLLDAMLEMPMERVLDRLPLPPAVGDALIGRAGRLGALLRLAEQCERPVAIDAPVGASDAAVARGAAPGADGAQADGAARIEGATLAPADGVAHAAAVDPLELARAQLAAIGWAERFGSQA